MTKVIKDFEELKRVLKSKLPEFLDRMNVKKGKGKANMYHSFYSDRADKNPSLHIFASFNNESMYHCFSSNRTGDIFMAHNIISGAPLIGSEFMIQNVKVLCDMFDVKYEFKPMSPEDIEEMNIRAIYSMIKDIVVTDFRFAPDNVDEKVKEYCAERQINPKEDGADFSLGYCANYENLMAELGQRGIDRKYLEKIGVKEYIFNPNNLIFSILDDRGVVRGFAVRNCHFDKNNRIGSKYYNTESNAVYSKGSILYNLQRALKKQSGKHSGVYITEGHTDAIALDKVGLKAAALGSTKFTNEHISLLQRVSTTDIILLLDGDAAGIDNTARTITEVMEGIRNFRVRIVTLPEGEDPDSFVRKFGKEKLLMLPHITAFEWRLYKLRDETDLDPHELAKQIIPLIVNESSALQRDRMCKQIAEVCDLPLMTVRKEVQNIMENEIVQQNDERDAILDNMQKLLKRSPTDAPIIVKNAHVSLNTLADRVGKNIYDLDEFVNEIGVIKSHQEGASRDDYLNIFRMPRFETKMKGSTSGKLFLIGGQPNTGKTLWLINYIVGLLRSHEDAAWYGQRADDDRFNNVSILYHTIDDSREESIPRFISALAYDKSMEVTINSMDAPNVEDNIAHVTNLDELLSARDWAYQKFEQWAKDGRLIIKDSKMGATLSSGDMAIRNIKRRFPDRHILYIIDNLHNLQDFSNIDDDVKRIKDISLALKQNILVAHGITGFCTVEYKKGQGDSKSRITLNELMKESKSLEYHANWVGHLVSEMHVDPDNTEMFFYDPAVPPELQGPDDKCPIVSLIVGKNKVSGYKGELHYYILPKQGVAREVTRTDVLNMSEGARNKLWRYYFRKNEDTSKLLEEHRASMPGDANADDSFAA